MGNFQASQGQTTDQLDPGCGVRELERKAADAAGIAAAGGSSQDES